MKLKTKLQLVTSVCFGSAVIITANNLKEMSAATTIFVVGLLLIAASLGLISTGFMKDEEN